VEKIKDRLAGWKANHLSIAGRITLAKFTIQAIPIYPMMSMPIPKSCLNEIEKVQRPFIWGDTEDKRKAHLISWDTMTQPKSCGGLGLRKLHSMNERKITVNSNDSPLWKALGKSWSKLEFHRCWSIGDGNKADFWTDKWLGENIRISDVEHHIPEEV
jgi:hypothetical protein